MGKSKQVYIFFLSMIKNILIVTKTRSRVSGANGLKRGPCKVLARDTF